MLKKYLFLLVALLGGAGGFLFRTWQLQTAFEPYTGLPIHAAPSTIVLVFFSLLMLAFFAGLAYSKRNEKSSQRTGEETQRSFFLLLVTCAAAAATAIAAYGFFQEGNLLQQLRRATTQPQEMNPFLVYLFAVVSLGSAVAILIIAFRRYQKKSQPNSLALLLPAFAGCLWLMVSYQKLAGDPFVTDYIFLLFAIMSGMLAHYFIAANSFQHVRTTPIYMAAGSAIYFSLTALASAPLSVHGLLCMAQVLYFAPTLLLLSSNDSSMKPIEDNSLADTASARDADYNPLKEENP